MTNTLVQTVKQDVEQWEKGKQWIFTCYSPVKERACFPCIDDISPEEMRLEAYKAKSANTVGDYQKRFNDLQNEYSLKRRSLLTPSEAIKDILRKIYNKEAVNIPPGTNIFQSGGGGSVFGGGGAGGGLFGGQQQQQQSVFGAKPSVFGGGASQPAQNTSSLFGGGNNSTQSAGSIFGGGGQTQAQSAGSIFGGQPKPQTSAFGQSGQSSLFGAPAQSSHAPWDASPCRRSLRRASISIAMSAGTGASHAIGCPVTGWDNSSRTACSAWRRKFCSVRLSSSVAPRGIRNRPP